jgi:hypothetical protein
MNKVIRFWLKELFEIDLTKKGFRLFGHPFFSNLFEEIESTNKLTMPFKLYLFLLACSVQGVVAQKNERIHYFECVAGLNYSISPSATQNLPGFGVGLFFHSVASNKFSSIRVGLDYQMVNMRVASILIDYSLYEENTLFSFNQLRLPLSFPIVLTPKSKVQVYVEPGCYFSMPLGAFAQSTLTERDANGNVISQYKHQWSAPSSPGFGVSFGAGVIFPQETKRFELRGDFNVGSGRVTFGQGPVQQFVFNDVLFRLSFMSRFPMKTKKARE